jgi:hypothetical protein
VPRKTRLVDCNPKWGVRDGLQRYIRFDCPEGHKDCFHVVPFTPALDGTVVTSPQQNGAIWERWGNTFETLTLTPSIRRIPAYPSREAALAAGCIPEYVDDSFLCAFHAEIQNGQIAFVADSR